VGVFSEHIVRQYTAKYLNKTATYNTAIITFVMHT